MKDWLLAHGVSAFILLVLACYNILGTAIVSVLDKVEAYLAPTNPVGGNPGIEKIKGIISKTAGWAASVVDWLIGNKAH